MTYCRYEMKQERIYNQISPCSKRLIYFFNFQDENSDEDVDDVDDDTDVVTVDDDRGRHRSAKHGVEFQKKCLWEFFKMEKLRQLQLRPIPCLSTEGLIS